jgi:hypothetical protein
MAGHRLFSLSTRVLPLALALCVVSLQPALAQGPTTGSIAGVVADDTGAVLPGAAVSALSPALIRTQTSVSNEQGQYRFPSLPPGVYKLTYELAGFSTVVRDGIHVNLGFAAQVNVVMNLASVEETVTVTGESPVVDAQNTTVHNNFTSEMLKSIPNARDIWSLMAEAPGMTVDRFDVGGSAAGTQPGYTAYGASGQNRVQIDGTNTTEGASAAGFYYDFGAFDEISFGASNAADAQMPVPGVLVNTVLKSGGNQVHGDAYFDYENESLQGHNVDDRLRRLGVGEGTRMKRYLDPNANIGGPIARNKLWYFTSIRSQEIATTTAGWPGPNFLTRLQNITYKLTYQLNQNNKVTHFLEWGRKFQPYRNADATQSIDSVYKQDSFSWAGKVEWNRIQSPTFYFDARLSTFGYNWPNYPYGVNGQINQDMRPRMYDQYTGDYAGAYYEERYRRRRYQGEIVANLFRDTWVRANHSIKFGWLTEWEDFTRSYNGYQDSIRLVFNSRNGIDFTTPYRVELYNHPTTFRESMWHHGAFVHDQISAGHHVTLNAGVRWDFYSSYEPENTVLPGPFRDFFYGGVPVMTPSGPFSLPPAPFAGTWTVPVRKGIIEYPAGIAPRLGVAYDVAGNGRTVVKANYGRFYNNPSTDLGLDTNPIQSTYAAFGWIDKNGDGKFTMDELGNFASLTGGARNTVQPGIAQPYTDEIDLFVERQLVTDLGLRVGYIYKQQKAQWALADLGRPRELWTMPFTVADPGPDGTVGTADDSTFTAYNMSTVTVSRLERQAPDADHQSYRNLDVTLNKRMSRKWSLVASLIYTWANESVWGAPQNPNQDLNNYTHTTKYTFKLFGSYQAPYGIVVSPVFRFQQGAPVPRRVTVSTNGGSFDMLAQPAGAYRQDNVAIFDTRIEKQVRVGRASRIGLFLDLFNINNSHAAQSQLATTGLRTVTVDGQTVTVPRFLYPTTIIAPRIARVGVKLTF